MARHTRPAILICLSLLFVATFLGSTSAQNCTGTCSATDLGDPAPGCDANSENATYNSDPVVHRFRRYLRVRTDQPNPNYCCAVEYLRSVVDSIGGLEMKEVSYGVSVYKPLLIVTWKGSDPSLPSILLNSHTDVVQADASAWTHDPFCAFMEKNGDIFARGAQDTKDIGMMYLEALRNLKNESFVPMRTIHVTFTPDEEIAGAEGFKAFANSSDFTDLNVGIALDEGGVTPGDVFTVYNREKAAWWLTIKSHGEAAHGAFMIKNGALENLFKTLPVIMEYRQTLVDKLDAGAADGDVTSISPTYLNAGITTDTGYVSNVQPTEATAGFDIRVSPDDNATALLNRISEEWAPVSLNMTFEFVEFNEVQSPTVANASNPWWNLLVKAVEESGYNLSDPQIVPAFTDARFVRAHGIPDFNFAPITRTISKLHGNDEYLNAEVYLAGIPVYENIIKEFASYKEANQVDFTHTTQRPKY